MLRADVAGRVRLHGRQPPESAWRIASGAAVGLALLEDTPAFRAALPTKVYEYLAAGMAVLATPLPRVERLLAEAGAGEVVRNAAEAARFLRHWAGPGRARSGAPARGRSRVAAHPGVVGVALRRTCRGASDNVQERRPRRREPALRRRYDASSTRRAAATRIEMELDVDEIGCAGQTSDGEHGSWTQPSADRPSRQPPGAGAVRASARSPCSASENPTRSPVPTGRAGDRRRTAAAATGETGEGAAARRSGELRRPGLAMGTCRRTASS